MKQPKDCNDGNLAEAVFEFARETHELHLELKRSNDNKAVLNRIAEMENKVMSAISDYAAKQKAYNERHGAALDSVIESQSGLTEDIAELNRKIEELQNSPGTITPEDQALLDEAQAQGEALATKSEGVAAALKILDEQTPPVVPPTPS